MRSCSTWPLPARRDGERGAAGNANLSRPPVHEGGTLAREHFPHPRQPDNRAVDVDRLRLIGPGIRLARHIYHRRRTADYLGLRLARHGRGSSVLWVLPAGKVELLARLRSASGCGCRYVCTVRPVLRVDSRNAAAQCRRWRDRTDKLLWRAGVVRGVLFRWVAQRSDGWFGRVVPLHGSCPAGISGPHSDAARPCTGRQPSKKTSAH